MHLTEREPPLAYTFLRVGLPVSINQEGRLLSDELGRLRSRPPSPQTAPFAIRIRGTLDVDALHRALTEVAKRHQGLRAALHPAMGFSPSQRIRHLRYFAETATFEPGLYAQSIASDPTVPIACDDVRELPEAERTEWLRTVTSAEGGNAFDPAVPCRMRGRLVRTETECHILLVTVDHLVCDRWAGGLIRREIALLYEHFATGSTYPFDRQPSQFPDFAVWERSFPETTVFREAASYWVDHWVRFGPARICPEQLPFYNQSLDTSPTWDVRSAVIPEEEWSHAAAGCRRLRQIPASLILAALSVVLGSRTGRSEIALWTQFANRALPHTQSMVGWLANTHLIGLDTPPTLCAHQALAAAGGCLASGYRHQSVSLAQLWRGLGYRPQRHPLKILVDFHSDSGFEYSSRSCGVTFNAIPVPRPVSPQWAGLTIQARWSTSMSLSATFRSDLFRPEGIEKLLDDVGLVARAIINHPATRLADLSEDVGLES